MPASWRAYGVDANKDGVKDPQNPVDAIFAAARYLKAAGYEDDVRKAIFAYNHADWYVDSVLLRADLIAGIPADLIGSLTGLTEGRFPVAARVRYADDLREREAASRVQVGENAANVVESDDDRRHIEIFAQKGSPVVAVGDGRIEKIGENDRLGKFVVMQDVYGNRYLYSGLDEVSQFHPVPKPDTTGKDTHDETSEADGTGGVDGEADGEADPAPTAAASEGRQPLPTKTDDEQPTDGDGGGEQPGDGDGAGGGEVPADGSGASLPIKERLFAHPSMPGSRESGGLEQLMDGTEGAEIYSGYFSLIGR